MASSGSRCWYVLVFVFIGTLLGLYLQLASATTARSSGRTCVVTDITPTVVPPVGLRIEYKRDTRIGAILAYIPEGLCILEYMDTIVREPRGTPAGRSSAEGERSFREDVKKNIPAYRIRA